MDLNLSELDELLNITPAYVEIQPVSLAFLEGVTVYDSDEELVYGLDNPLPTPPRRLLIKEPRIGPQRFPSVKCTHFPFTSELNKVLFTKFEFIAESMLTQKEVGDRIVESAQGFDTLVLLLIDGLSYKDCADWENTEPCLVVGPSTTFYGFISVVGAPPIATTLLEVGFRDRLGFSYWNRKDEELTNRIFYAFQDVSKVISFREVLKILRHYDLKSTYIQIVRSGLDGYAHKHRDMPLKAAVVEEIRKDVNDLLALLQEKKLKAKVHLVSDHGILWRDEHPFEVIDLPSEGRSGPIRYFKQGERGHRGKPFEVGEKELFLLDYPQIRRNFRSNEWGAHGSISFEESVVPFVSWEVS